jgi:hypothetical protein
MSQLSSSDVHRARVPRSLLSWLVSSVTLGVLALIAIGAAGAAVPTAPPPVTVLTSTGNLGDGAIFVTPTGGTATYANGPEILDAQGKVVWFHPIPQGQTAADFRTQTYRGKRVLTWWQGTGLGGLAQGTDYIYDDQYRQIATVQAGNGLHADGHEFLITPWNTALILAYTTAKADLTSIGGPANQTVINGVVQEIDIATGKVLFEWNSADHVPFGESKQPLPASASTPWDWFHINAVHVDTDHNLLVDARNTWTTYKVNSHSGDIVCRLGGTANSFTIEAAPGQVLDNANEIFAWQHDPEALGHDVYTFFDNEAAGSLQLPYSRVVTVKLDEKNHVATLVGSVRQPEGLSAPSQGNGQTTANGDLFVGWGSLPYFSAFDSAGNLFFNAQFPAGVNSYRAYFLPWEVGDSQ